MPSEVSNFSPRWDGHSATFTFTASGQSISGNVQVNQSQIVIVINLPWLASLVIDEEAISTGIRRKVEALLS
ncbi:polyhydroxyalkanoic acid system family protein [Patescibacteria group bacterium]|nr:polyhydroxyalkanoic acid system family protein [Patescibacteria group bacterium]